MLMTMIPLILVAVVSYSIVSKQLHETLVDRLVDSMRGVEIDTEVIREDLLASVRAIAEDGKFRRALVQQQRQALLNAAEQARNVLSIDSVTITDPQGVVLARGHDPASYGDSITAIPAVGAALRGERTAGIAKCKAGIGVTITMPVMETGRMVGILSVERVLGYRFVSRLKGKYGLDVTVLDGDRLQATTFGDSRIIDDVMAYAQRERKVWSDDEDAIIETVISGTEHFIAARPILSPQGQATGMLLVTVSQQAINETIRLLFILGGIAVAPLVLVAFLVSYRFTRGIVRPINTLVEMTAKVADGDRTSKVDAPSKDEVGQLARSFNTMIDQLRETTTSVENLNREIEDRKRAEAALRESEAKFRHMYQNAQVGMARTSISDGTITECNDKAAQLMGYDDRESMIGDFVASEHYVDPQARRDMLAKLEAEGRFDEFEAEITRSDGRSLWLSFSSRIYPAEGYLESVLVDVTERRRAEKALAEKVAFLNLLNTVTTAANEAGTLNEALEGAVEQVRICMGWPTGCVWVRPGKSDAEVTFVSLSSEDGARFEPLQRAMKEYPHTERMTAVQDAFAARTPGWISCSQASDGEKYPLMPVAVSCGIRSAVSLPVLVGDEAVAVLQFGLDEDEAPDETLMTVLADVGVQLGRVAERAQAETVLRASEEKFRAMFNQAFQFAGMLSVEGNVLAINETALRFIGIEEADVLGMPFWETPWWTHSAAMQQTLRDAIERASQGELVRFAADHFDARGKLRIVDVSLKPVLDADGTVAYLIPEGRDITELRQAEREVRQLNKDLEQRVADRTAELKAANEELEAFTYSVSHDLRAPIRHIDGFARMLADRREAGLDDEGLRLLGVIQNSSQRMGMLIDDLLTLSRLGRQSVQREDVDFDTMARDVWSELTSNIDSSGMTFRIESLPPVCGDPRLLRQVWLNLLDNALKYTGGREHREIVVDSFDDEGKLWYRIQDDGVGFDPRYTDKLFGVFQRLHRTDEFPGTGVGLAIVQRIVHKHGGRIRARGEVDRGATFEFTLGD